MTLERKTPLQRTTPLVAKTGLRRTTPLQQKAGRESLAARSVPLRRSTIARKAPKPAVTPKVRSQIRRRSGGLCELWMHGICAEVATEASHRIKRGSGGRHGEAAERNGRASNVTYSCSPCHAEAHRRPELARHWGWMLLENADPPTSPALIRGQWSLLSDDGEVTPCAEPER